jgi:hypothetical protein
MEWLQSKGFHRDSRFLPFFCCSPHGGDAVRGDAGRSRDIVHILAKNMAFPNIMKESVECLAESLCTGFAGRDCSPHLDGVYTSWRIELTMACILGNVTGRSDGFHVQCEREANTHRRSQLCPEELLPVGLFMSRWDPVIHPIFSTNSDRIGSTAMTQEVCVIFSVAYTRVLY